MQDNSCLLVVIHALHGEGPVNSSKTEISFAKTFCGNCKEARIYYIKLKNVTKLRIKKVLKTKNIGKKNTSFMIFFLYFNHAIFLREHCLLLYSLIIQPI